MSQLKIDRSFVREIQDSASLVPIIHATVAMAQGLGFDVIAEGIETSEQLQYLRRLGCAHAQGYLLARPQDAQAISALLTGALPWAAVLGATCQPPERRRTRSRRLFDTPGQTDAGRTALGAVARDLKASDVIRAAETVAATAAAEVAADAAVTAQAEVTAACTAALHAAKKAERVAAQAAEAAATATRGLVVAEEHLHQPQWDTTTSLDELLAGDSYSAEDAARDVATSRTAAAAASAVRKVAAQVESAAVVAAAAAATAAELIEIRLVEDAAAAARTVARSTPASDG